MQVVATRIVVQVAKQPFLNDVVDVAEWDCFRGVSKRLSFPFFLLKKKAERPAKGNLIYIWVSISQRHNASASEGLSEAIMKEGFLCTIYCNKQGKEFHHPVKVLLVHLLLPVLSVTWNFKKSFCEHFYCKKDKVTALTNLEVWGQH